jgi:hypothetical protein
MVYDGSYMATYMDRMIEVCYLELCSTGDVAEMYVCSTFNHVILSDMDTFSFCG